MKIHNKLSEYALVPAIVTVLLLLIPLVAMQFTDEVIWSPFDFAVAGSLLFGTGLSYNLITKNISGNLNYRIGMGLALATALFLVWANLAVGLIGSENNPANLMYFGLLALVFFGAILSRFQPRGMVVVLMAAALAQALIAAIALIAGMQHSPVSSVNEILMVNALFIVLWIGSALFMRNAARDVSSFSG